MRTIGEGSIDGKLRESGCRWSLEVFGSQAIEQLEDGVLVVEIVVD